MSGGQRAGTDKHVARSRSHIHAKDNEVPARMWSTELLTSGH